MPDRPQSDEEAVRRLLADARVDEPMPPAVVARLDRVLADLQDQRAGSDELAARRRRSRFLTRAVAAAVAVVALGAGVRWLDGTGGLAGGDGAASSDAGGGAELAPDDRGAAAPGTLPYLRPGHLRADILERVPDRMGAAVADTGGPACVLPRAGQVALPVSYGRRLAALVLDPPAGGRQRATVLLCRGVHSGNPVRTVDLPAP